MQAIPIHARRVDPALTQVELETQFAHPVELALTLWELPTLDVQHALQTQ